MGLEGNYDDPKYKGFSKYFNSYTIRGRSNWAKLWLSVYAISYITYKIIRNLTRKKPTEEQVKQLSMKPAGVPSPSSSLGPNETPSHPWNVPVKEYGVTCQPDGIAPMLPNQPRGGEPNLIPNPSQQPFYPYYPPPACYPYYPPPMGPEGSGVPNNQQTQPPGQFYPSSPYPCYPPIYFYPPYPYGVPPTNQQQAPSVSPQQAPSVSPQQAPSVSPQQAPSVSLEKAPTRCPEEESLSNVDAAPSD